MNKFLKSYFLFLALFIFVAGIPILYLYRSGEYMGLEEIVLKQQKTESKVLYGTALHVNTRLYKKELLANTQPKVIALGSSRVMQFRQHMFSDVFLNLGGGMESIHDGINLIPDIIKRQPVLIILGLDVWWFNDRFQKPDIQPAEISFNPRPSFSHSRSVFKWLRSNKISLNEYVLTIIKGAPEVSIGVSGLKRDGFGVDGSYYYTRTITGQIESSDKGFNGTFKRIENGNKRFQYNSYANNQHIDNIVQLIRRLEENDINVIVFFPPFANAVIEKLSNMEENYKYISDIKAKLIDSNIVFSDFSNPMEIKSHDCEFIDGFHGGEITYIRILEDLGHKFPSLNKLLNQDFLRESIKLYSGRAFIPDNEITQQQEVDFLELGCTK